MREEVVAMVIISYNLLLIRWIYRISISGNLRDSI